MKLYILVYGVTRNEKETPSFCFIEAADDATARTEAAQELAGRDNIASYNLYSLGSKIAFTL